MIVNEDHALAQPGEFSMPVGTVIVLDVDSAGTYFGAAPSFKPS